jgi:hypothetical protein
MNKEYKLREIIDLPNEILHAGKAGDLILFIGSGVSRGHYLPSWGELANQALIELREKDYLNFSEIEQLKTLDPKMSLSISRLIAQDNNYNLDLTNYLKGKSKTDSIY